MRLRHLGRLGAAAASSLALMVAAAGVASAHECFNASRSDQGNASAGAHSAAWETVSLDTVLTQFIGLPSDLAACVEAKAPAAGVPSSFTFGMKQAVGQGGVIAERNPNMEAKGLGSDGKGIDHAEDAYGEAIGMLIEECSAPA
ncbi:hypothetical protein [Segeticoccus rhizosphaerae]|jgi:hypothetical protein|uniref:hypothetical protein n=1 Tax=Segeticoccus rhizosphaerae TaxID=1104777 RepID=UPI0010C1391C|nr:hypothetical protein [Ornithinicoccus soli]